MFRLATGVRAVALGPLRVSTRTWFGFGVKYDPKDEQIDGMRYLKPLPDDHANFYPTKSDRELRDREALTAKFSQIADANPEELPSPQLLSELAQLLIKYNDRRGLLNLRDFTQELGVKPDADTQKLVDVYLVEAQRRCLYEQETF
eukprot:m.48763 g.48763  ORF g.48763 m.48763 type:complete len:146 (-) comp47791_c0_seq1:167-604(-)